MTLARLTIGCIGLLAAFAALADGDRHSRGNDHSRGDGHSGKPHHGHGSAAVCSVSAMNLAFGAYDEFQLAHRDSTGYVAVRCYGRRGEHAAYTISIGAGNGSFAYRYMRGPDGARLNYNLYTSPARVTVWGDGSGSSVTVSDSYSLGSGAVTKKYPIYGRLFSLQKKPVGVYTDTLIVTLDY